MDTANLLVRQFVESHPRDAAQALEQLDLDEAVGLSLIHISEPTRPKR